MGNYDFDGYGGPLSWTAQHQLNDCFMLPAPDSIANLPEKFDLRAEGGASPVKDKGRSPNGIGICWLFAAIASLESYLLYKKKVTSEDQDLHIQSELHGAYSTFELADSNTDKDYINPRGRKPGVKPDGKPAYGGYRYMAINYLTRDAGTTPWLLDPYYKEDMIDQKLKKRKWNITENKPGKYYVKEVRYLPDPMPAGGDANFVLLVKSYLIQYGGVSCSIFWDDKYLKSWGGNTYTYFDNSSGNNSNHAVTIMGWDDNYSKNNFLYTPKNDGAFLVKNCWGNIDAGGYFWVSYECANFGGRAYCVTDTETDYYGDTVKIYQHDLYGYNDRYVPYSNNSKIAKAKNIFNYTKGDKLVGISFYACSACYVTLSCSGIQGNIKEKYLCPTPGYYTYTLNSPAEITDDPTVPKNSFSITVEYKSATNLPAYIPLEVNDEDDDIYAHWKIDGAKSQVYREADKKWVPITELDEPEEDIEYGYFCMKAIVRNDTDKDAEKVKSAYDTLKLPALYTGYTGLLPNEINGVALEWRLEPYKYSEYGKTYSSTVSMFEIKSGGQRSYGLINAGTEKANAYPVATIGSGSTRMRKIFNTSIGAISEEYVFNCTAVEKYDCRSTITGEFEIPGAVVSISANGRTEKTAVKEDGTWELEDFALYEYEDGWKEDYHNTTVTVEIKSTNGILLTKGQRYINLECPYDEKGSGELEAFTFVGVAAALFTLAAGVGGCLYICSNITCPLGTGTAGGGAAFAAGGNIDIMGTNPTTPVRIATAREVAAFNRVHNIQNIEYTLLPNADRSEENKADSEKWGALAVTVSKGGSIKNCKVTGKVNNLRQFGGLFYQGEDVTVEGCTVDLQAKGGSGTFAGVAVELTGSKNSITKTKVTGTVAADNIAGLVKTMAGGAISSSGVKLEAQANSSFAGMIENGTGVEISNTIVSAKANVSDGKAAGALLSMNGGKIENCRISADLSAPAGAYGIAGAVNADARIVNCYSACRLTAKNGDVCGITEGIKDHPEIITGCVSVGSHFSGSNVARVSKNSGSNCAAYDSITFDGQLSTGEEKLYSSNELFTKAAYEAVGWKFGNSPWYMDESKDHPQPYPTLVNGIINQSYDFPFLYPKLPQSGKFEYKVNDAITILGLKNEEVKNVSWTLSSPIIPTDVLASGNCDFMEKGEDCYIQFNLPSLIAAGDYILTLTSILGEHKYDTKIILHIKEAK